MSLVTNGVSSAASHEQSTDQPTQRTTMPPPPLPAQARSPVVMNDENIDLPTRHPRPLTAAELYLECEKEQEAVVNRLTRELTALRARSASVASNASRSSTSTSASLLPVDISDPNPTHQLTGATHPTPSRRRRRSSSISIRSIPTPSTTVSNVSTSQAHINGGTSVSQASLARAQAAASGNLSRQPSISASGTSTPARQSMDLSRYQMHSLPHRPSVSRDISFASSQAGSTAAQAGTPVPQRVPSPALSPAAGVQVAMQHYAEATAFRNEMESVKAENEALKQRVRALERALRARRRDSSVSDAAPRPETTSRYSREGSASTTGMQGSSVAAWAAGSGVGGVAGPRERSESQSTTASSRRGITVDEEVRVGESAASLNARGP